MRLISGIRGPWWLFVRAAALVAVPLFAVVAGVVPLRDAVADEPPDYFVDETKLPFGALSGTTTTRLWGVQGGAGYRIEVPEDWNGDLVLYAHGFRGNPLELTVSNPPIRRYLVEHGFAWAASSYATNGYDVAQGVKDTHDLGVLFNGLVGLPDRVYFTGTSMGGHITGVAVEQYPNAYDGAMPMCGVMGDSALFDYFVENHLVALALTGLDVSFPFPSGYTSTVVPQLRTAFGAPYPSVLTPLGLTFAAVVENLSGGDRPMFEQAFRFSGTGGNFLLGQGVGSREGFVGNMDRVYQIDSDPALSPDEQQLNEDVQRVEVDPSSRHPDGMAAVPAINGTIRIPILSLHTLGDLFVPFSMEQIYAREVAARGGSDLLVTRAIRDISHCGFNPTEMEQGFAALVDWVENGIKPAGDDILTPSTVADPDFGCQFTVGAHTLAPPCP